MEKKQTAVQQIIGKYQMRVGIAEENLQNDLNRRDKIHWEKVKRTYEGLIKEVSTLLPIEKQQIEEAFDAGKNKRHFDGRNTQLTDASDYFTTTYKGE